MLESIFRFAHLHNLPTTSLIIDKCLPSESLFIHHQSIFDLGISLQYLALCVHFISHVEQIYSYAICRHLAPYKINCLLKHLSELFSVLYWNMADVCSLLAVVIHVDEGDTFDLAKRILKFHVVCFTAFLHLLDCCFRIIEGVLHFVIERSHVFLQELWELGLWQANRNHS